jgi:hypothetical protein
VNEECIKKAADVTQNELFQRFTFPIEF